MINTAYNFIPNRDGSTRIDQEMYHNGRQDTQRLKEKNSYKALACFTYICKFQL